MFDLINGVRVKKGCKPLRHNDRLYAAGASHLKHLAQYGYLGANPHYGRKAPGVIDPTNTPVTRHMAAGYPAVQSAENLAMTSDASPENVRSQFVAECV